MGAAIWPGLLMAALSGCAASKPRPVIGPLPPDVSAWMGCYTLNVAWDTRPTEEHWRVLLSGVEPEPPELGDTNRLAQRRRHATLLLPRRGKQVAQFGRWWLIPSDTLMIHIIYGREGQGLSLWLTRQVEDVTGRAALRDGGPNPDVQTVLPARVSGHRADCAANEVSVTSAP